MMNPLIVIMLIKLMTGGLIADHRWMEIARDLVVDAELRLPEPAQGRDTRAWLRRSDRTRILTLQTSIDPFRDRLKARFRFRVDCDLMGGTPVASTAVEIRSGRWKLQVGPLRGGMGGGALVRANALNYRGAGVQSAWSGVPSGLRTGPASASSDAPLSITLRRVDGKGPSLAILQDRGTHQERNDPVIALGVLNREGCGGVILGSGAGTAAEIVLGSRKGPIRWRLSAARWCSPDRGDGASLEAVMTSGKGPVSWEIRFWSWDGSAPPMAPPVPGATKDRRRGIRLAAGMNPPGPLRGDLSVVAAGAPGQVAGPGWWREQVEVSWRSLRRAGWLLRLRRTTDLERLSWEPDRVTERRLGVARLWSGTRGKLSGSGELRAESENSRTPSIGGWLQTEFQGKGWNGFVRGTYSQPQPGLPLYWYEPGPTYIWRLRAERERDLRFTIGFSTRPEGLRCQIELTPGSEAGFLVGWRTSW